MKVGAQSEFCIVFEGNLHKNTKLGFAATCRYIFRGV